MLASGSRDRCIVLQDTKEASGVERRWNEHKQEVCACVCMCVHVCACVCMCLCVYGNHWRHISSTGVPCASPPHFNMQVCGLKWSPDKQYLASGGNDNKLMLWSCHSSRPVHVFNDHLAAVKAIAWSPHQHGMSSSPFPLVPLVTFTSCLQACWQVEEVRQTDVSASGTPSPCAPYSPSTPPLKSATWLGPSTPMNWFVAVWYGVLGYVEVGIMVLLLME